jgi:hypothetical protein
LTSNYFRAQWRAIDIHRVSIVVVSVGELLLWWQEAASDGKRDVCLREAATQAENQVANWFAVRAQAAGSRLAGFDKSGQKSRPFRIDQPIEATILGGATDGTTSAATVARRDVPPKHCREPQPYETAGPAACLFCRFALLSTV